MIKENSGEEMEDFVVKSENFIEELQLKKDTDIQNFNVNIYIISL